MRRRGGAALGALDSYRVGGLSSVYYVPDYLSAAEEEAIAEQLGASPPAMWQEMQGRRVQECGSAVAADGRGLVLEALPPWMRAVCARLVRDGFFPESMRPNSVSLNEYGPTEGIAPHADGPIYAPRVAILSLFSPAVFRLYGAQPELRRQLAWDEQTDTPRHAPRGAPQECLLLQPRSLLLFAGDAFQQHCHEVAACPSGREVVGDAASGPLVNGALAGAATGDTVLRGHRVSLTVRHLLEFLLAPDG